MVYSELKRKDSKIYILFWGSFFKTPNWGHDFETTSDEYLEKLGCEFTNCVMTHRVDLLPEVYKFDAVIFNVWDEELTLPKLRSPHQLYIMVSKELSFQNLKKYKLKTVLIEQQTEFHIIWTLKQIS